MPISKNEHKEWRWKDRPMESGGQRGRVAVAKVKDPLLIDKLLREKEITPSQHQCGIRYIRMFSSMQHLRLNQGVIDGYAARGNGIMEAWYVHLITNNDYYSRLIMAMAQPQKEFVHMICVDEIAPSNVCQRLGKRRNDWAFYVRDAFELLEASLEGIDKYFEEIRNEAQKIACKHDTENV